MTFASRMQHQIYWGPLKKPIEWSLKTVLAPWAYLASVAYHDTFWYPLVAKRRMKEVLASDWGRLFANWEKLTPDERGFPSSATSRPSCSAPGFAPSSPRSACSLTCLREAPEFAARKRTRELGSGAA